MRLHYIKGRREITGAVAIDVHRLFHHDSTALTTRASGQGWTPAGVPHIQGVHRNLRINPIDPSSPLQQLTHTTVTLIVSCILNSRDVWFCPPYCGLYSCFRAQNKIERLSPLEPGISSGVTEYTYRNTRHRRIKTEFSSIFPVLVDLTAEVYLFIYLFCFTHSYFPASGQAVVTGVVPSSPGFLPSIFIAHRVQHSHCSSIFHRMLLTRALALSASHFVHKKKSPLTYTGMHSGGFELTKLTYNRLEDNLIRHRGDRNICTSQGYRYDILPNKKSVPE